MNKSRAVAYFLGGTVLMLLILFVFGQSWVLSWGTISAVYKGKWQAVYLDNNQVLYGRIRGISRHTIKLTDVYYLQTVEVGGKPTSNLVKRGQSEISGPENFLFVNREHVLYWEQVGEDSQVMGIVKQSTD